MGRSILYRRFGIAVAAILVIGAVAIPAMAQTNAQYWPFQRSQATIELTNSGVTISPTDLGPGAVDFTVENKSDQVRGVVLSGVDSSGTPIIRYSPRIRPGETSRVSFFFYQGTTYTVADYIERMVSRGESIFKSTYETKLTIPTSVPIGRGPVYEQHSAMITIGDNSLDVTPQQSTLGPVVFTIKNDTRMPKGVIISGQDRSGSRIVRYSRIVRPGHSATMNFWLFEGRTYKIQDYSRRVMRGKPEYASRFTTDFVVQPAPVLGVQ